MAVIISHISHRLASRKSFAAQYSSMRIVLSRGRDLTPCPPLLWERGTLQQAKRQQ